MTTEAVTWILFWINAFQFYYFICAFLEARIKHYYVGAFVYAACCMAMRLVSNMFEGDAYNIAILFVAIFQSILVYPLFIVKRWYHPWILEVILMVGNLLLQIPVIWMVELITGSNVLLEGNNARFDLNYSICSSIMCMLFMVAVFIAYAIRFIRIYKISKGLLVATMGVVIYQTLVILFFYILCRNDGESAVYGGVLFVGFSILSDMAVLKSIENLLEKRWIEREWRTLLIKRQREYEYYVNLQSSIEKMRMERHDCVNYLQVVQKLLEEKNSYSDAKKLIMEIKSTIQ